MSRLSLALTLSLTALASACVDNNADSGLVLLRNIAPTEGCVVSTSGEVSQASGVIDVASRVGYVLTPLLRNDLVTVEGESTTAKSIFVNGAKVTIEFYDTDLFTAAEVETMTTDGLVRFIAPTSGAIEPNGGLQTYQLEVVPSELMAKIAPKLLVTTTEPNPSTVLDLHVQFFGERASGDSVSSNTFRYPVEVCKGCLTHVVGACEGLPTDVEYQVGGLCNRDQDGVTDCCTDPLGALVCPAIGVEPQPTALPPTN